MSDDVKSSGEEAQAEAKPVELSEGDLAQVAGGVASQRKAGEAQKDYVKITMKEVFITS